MANFHRVDPSISKSTTVASRMLDPFGNRWPLNSTSCLGQQLF
jgi:hypothetical protein